MKSAYFQRSIVSFKRFKR